MSQEISKVSHIEWDYDETRTSEVIIETIEVINQMLKEVNIKLTHEKSVAPNIIYVQAKTMKEKK